MVTTPLKSLLYSRKFLLAVFGIITTLVLNYYNVDPEVWAAIDGLVIVLIGSIAHEDAAEKSGAQSIQAGNVETIEMPTPPIGSTHG